MIVGGAASLHDGFQTIDFAVDIAAQLTQSEHTERVADLLQEFQLRYQFGRLVHAGADENIQYVLDPRQVLLDRRRDRLHQLDAGRRECLPGLLYLLVARQQLGKVERGADFADALAGRAGPCHVIQQVVQEIVDRVLVERIDTFVDHELDLPVRLCQQALECNGRLEPAVLQGLEHAARHPPQLVHVVARGRMFQRGGHFRQRFEMLFLVAALDPSEQCQLEFRSQAAGNGDGVLPTRLGPRHGSLAAARRQVQQQQGALGQQWFAARSTQVIEHRQQHECNIPAAAEQALDVRGQLHHRTRQGVESVFPALARAQCCEVPAGKFHFLGEQRRAVGFRQLQGAARLVQLVPGADERLGAAAAIDAILDGKVRIADRLHQLVADDGECVYRARDFALLSLVAYAGIARHRFLDVSPCLSSFPAARGSHWKTTSSFVWFP